MGSHALLEIRNTCVSGDWLLGTVLFPALPWQVRCPFPHSGRWAGSMQPSDPGRKTLALPATARYR